MAEPDLAARALDLLATAYPDMPGMKLAQLPIGERDGRLLAFHEQVFGARLAALAVCPRCESRMEFEFSVADVTTPCIADGNTGKASLVCGEYEIAFHVPTALDLAAIHRADDFEERKALLLKQVIDTAACRGEPISEEELPPEVVAVLEEKLDQADPQGNVQLNLVCGVCRGEWHAVFDIAAFLWGEVHAWALRLMREVHCLARAYAWSESDILAMSSWRRQRYLEMLGE